MSWPTVAVTATRDDELIDPSSSSSTLLLHSSVRDMGVDIHCKL